LSASCFPCSCITSSSRCLSRSCQRLYTQRPSIPQHSINVSSSSPRYRGWAYRYLIRFSIFASSNSPTTVCMGIETHRSQPGVAQAQLPQQCQGKLHFCDSSWPLYSMYSKFAQEEDDKMAERCQTNADGILIFVSPHECFCVAAQTNLRNTGRSILSDHRHIPYHHVPRSTTKFAGCLCVLSREYLSASRHSGF